MFRVVGRRQITGVVLQIWNDADGDEMISQPVDPQRWLVQHLFAAVNARATLTSMGF